mmetsp:Transcript_25188/g.79396  ORF Transcript_25188/g.79396 Transcript_25188/m.79396 type:complete len:294 (+) Transcript_25188:139-1020(+)
MWPILDGPKQPPLHRAVAAGRSCGRAALRLPAECATGCENHCDHRGALGCRGCARGLRRRTGGFLLGHPGHRGLGGSHACSARRRAGPAAAPCGVRGLGAAAELPRPQRTVEAGLERRRVGVPQLAQPKPHGAGDRHREEGARDAPDAAPEGHSHGYGQGVQLQALGHDPGLNDVPCDVVHKEGHEDDERHVRQRAIRLEPHERHGQEDGHEGAQVGNVVEQHREGAKGQRQRHLQELQGNQYEESDEQAGGCLPDEVLLYHALQPRAVLAMDARQHGYEAEQVEHDREQQAL